MADSFFGFNTSIDENEDGGTFEASEDEYDALNDETFGETVDDGDWEQQHEEFSLLTESTKHIDIEGALSNLILDNDTPTDAAAAAAAAAASAQHRSRPFSLQSMVQQPGAIPSISCLKNVCTVEELERNLRQMQQFPQPNLQKPPLLPFFQQQPPRYPPGMMPPPPQMLANQQFMPAPGLFPYRLQSQPPPNHLQHHYGNMMPPPNSLPPGGVPRPPLVPGMDHQGMYQMHFNQQPPNNFNNQNVPNQQRFPVNPQMPPPNNPQFPPNQQHFLHNQHQFPPNQPQFPPNQSMAPNPPQPQPNVNQQQRPQLNQQPNNRNHQIKPGVAPQPNPNRQFPNTFNNVNGPANKAQNDTNNIIQMIQNTHPMLQNNSHSNYMNAFIANPMLARGLLNRHFGNAPPGFNQQSGMQRQDQRRQNADADPYSGLMSTKEKQWLLNIQMMQLNTGTPYVDDYYYTVFLERRARKQKEVIKEAHKVNQENHPFSQQNLANNKFNQYNNHGKDGENRRERCNSTRSNNENSSNKEGLRTYVPTQFENSLGKLQCCSVTAPRKIIDMEVIGSESPTGETRCNAVGSSTAGVIGAPRGTRHILLAIETLFRILLRLEDLSEPLAIANALVLKERDEKQRALLLEQQQMEALERGDDDDDDTSPDDPPNNFLRDIENVQKQNSSRTSNAVGANVTNSILPSHNTNPVLPNLLDENKPDLLGKLFAGLLFEDRLSSFMTIRKGKMLVIRILGQASPTEKWKVPLGKVWFRLVKSLPYALRRDISVLTPLVDHFRRYLNGTEGWTPVSDLCFVLSEESPVGPASQRASSVPIRSVTPSLPSRNLMYFIMSSSIGLSILVVLMERAAVLPKPAPAAWNNMIKCAGRLTTASGNARPTYPVSREVLAAHCAAAELPSGADESLAEALAHS